MIKRHIVSRRLLLKSKWGDNLFLRVVRAFVIIRGALFSDKSPFLNHLLALSTTLLSCSVAGATIGQLTLVILAVGIHSFFIFHGYAFLFSSKTMTTLYLRLRRWFEGAFAIGFGVASVKILGAKLL